MVEATGTDETERREAAIKRLKKKRDFKAHVFAYVVINAFLVGVWALTGAGFFWPAFVLVGWGVGLVFNAWDVYARQDISEEEIRREMEKSS